jgi:hypothetical protein
MGRVLLPPKNRNHKLIADTRTTKGPTIQSVLDQNTYEKGIRITDQELAQLRITREDYHGDGTYSIHPRKASS